MGNKNMRSSGSGSSSSSAKSGTAKKVEATPDKAITNGVTLANTQPSHLKFKSLKTGTLKSKTEPAPIRAIMPLPPPPPPSSLNAQAATFVPQEKDTHSSKSSEQSPNTFAFSQLKALIHSMPSRSENVAPTYNQYNPNKNYLEGNGNYHQKSIGAELSSSNTTALALARPFNPPTGPRAKSHFKRADASKKDIFISSSGIVRNMTRISTHVLPNGIKYYTRSEEFAPENYDFLNALKEMEVKERKKLFREKQIEFCIDIALTDEEDVVYKTVSVVDTENTTDQYGQEKEEKTEIKMIQKKVMDHPIINMITELGPEFVNTATNVTVTLVFSMDPTAPKRTSTSYALITALVDELQSFRALYALDVNLQVQMVQDVRHDLSMEQLAMVLPFYDLGFEDWRVMFQKPYMAKPIEVHGWCIGALDREMHKIMEARDREAERKRQEIEEKKFVRYSAAPNGGEPFVWRLR